MLCGDVLLYWSKARVLEYVPAHYFQCTTRQLTLNTLSEQMSTVSLLLVVLPRTVSVHQCTLHDVAFRSLATYDTRSGCREILIKLTALFAVF